MLQLTTLRAAAEGIADLTGLEYASFLTDLNLSHNQITDVSPLSEWSGLRTAAPPEPPSPRKSIEGRPHICYNHDVLDSD